MWHFAHCLLGYLPLRCCVVIAWCQTTKQLCISGACAGYFRWPSDGTFTERLAILCFTDFHLTSQVTHVKSRSGRLREARSCGVGVHYLITDREPVLKLARHVRLPLRQSGVYIAMRFCTFLLKTLFGQLTLLTTALLDIFEGGGGDAMDIMRKQSQIWTLPMSERKALTSSNP
jgi:hypothetical protein